MLKYFSAFMKNDSGATAIEYGLLASLIAVGIILAVTSIGGSVKGAFEKVAKGLDPKYT